MLKLEIGYDQSDDLFRQLLLDAYDSVVYCNNETWVHPDDVAHNAEILHAVSVLMDYISVGDQGKKALEAVHNKYKYHKLIASMGND